MTRPSPPPITDRFALTAAVIGAVALALGWIVAVQRPVPDIERTVFEAVNGGPTWVADSFWLIMVFGTLAGPIGVAVVCAVVWRRLHPALDVLVAGVIAWALAPVVKDMVARGRPAAYVTDVVVHDGGAAGWGFVSGHATVAFAVATALAPSLDRVGRVAVFAVASLVAVGRLVYGVHLPIDVVGGAGLGMLCGVAVRLLFDRLTPDREPAPT